MSDEVETIEYEGKTYRRLEDNCKVIHGDLWSNSEGAVLGVIEKSGGGIIRYGCNSYWREVTPDWLQACRDASGKGGGVTTTSLRMAILNAAQMYHTDGSILNLAGFGQALAKVAGVRGPVDGCVCAVILDSRDDVRRTSPGKSHYEVFEKGSKGEPVDPARAVVLEMSEDEAKAICKELRPQWHRGAVRALLDALGEVG